MVNNKLDIVIKLIGFFIAILMFAITSTAHAVGRLDVGSGSYTFIDSQGNKDKPITLWYHNPKEHDPNIPVVFVMHGVKRNGREYRDSWVKHAEKGKFLLLVPEFSKKYYQKSRRYNLGNMFTSSGKPISKSKWTYTAIEHIFDHVKTIEEIKTETYSIYGHSAGAQFVHRLVLYVPEARIETAICANAGWYTLPTSRVEFPYGLRKSRTSTKIIKKAFAKNLIILLGEKDTDKNHKHLRKTPQAMAQGKHRLERGRYFFDIAKFESARLKIPLNWKLQTVKGVAHSNSKMAKAAVRLELLKKFKNISAR